MVFSDQLTTCCSSGRKLAIPKNETQTEMLKMSSHDPKFFTYLFLLFYLNQTKKKTFFRIHGVPRGKGVTVHGGFLQFLVQFICCPPPSLESKLPNAQRQDRGEHHGSSWGQCGCSAHKNGASHDSVDGAVVRILSICREDVREGLPRSQGTRVKKSTAIRSHSVVVARVRVGPNHLVRERKKI